MIFSGMVSLSERNSVIDAITLHAEVDRMNLKLGWSSADIETLASYTPASGNLAPYADLLLELSDWRVRNKAANLMRDAASRKDMEAWGKAEGLLDLSASRTFTSSWSAEQWGSMMFDHYAIPKEEALALAIPTPFRTMTAAMSGGIRPGEVAVVAGPTSHGKSIWADMSLDTAAAVGKRCHVYMTEMTAIARGERYISRQTGISLKKQRERNLTPDEMGKILATVADMKYGCSVVADWDIDDIMRDALRARYDFVVVDLLHGFHYENERELDRLSKSMQKLARVSTTIDGHTGTAVMPVAHLKEEGVDRDGKIPRPTLASIKGGASIKQDADAVFFVWQEQDGKTGLPNGNAEIWSAKGRSSGLHKVEAKLNPMRFTFDPKDSLETVQEQPTLTSPGAAF